jgi:hypothetical protein
MKGGREGGGEERKKGKTVKIAQKLPLVPVCFSNLEAKQ